MPRKCLPEEERRIHDRKAHKRYMKTDKGKAAVERYRKSESRRASALRYTQLKRKIAGYKKWESLRGSAYRESKKQMAASNIFKPYVNPFVEKPMTTREVADDWGILPWREFVWYYVDYSKYEIKE